LRGKNQIKWAQKASVNKRGPVSKAFSVGGDRREKGLAAKNSKKCWVGEGERRRGKTRPGETKDPEGQIKKWKTRAGMSTEIRGIGSDKR